MDKWTTLEPVKLHSSSLNSITGGSSTKNSILARAASHQNRAQYIGILPSDLHLLILCHLAIPDIPNYARTNRALSRLVKDGGDSKIWKERLAVLRRIGRPLSCVKPGDHLDYNRLLVELEKRHRSVPKRGHKKGSVNGSSSSIDLSDFGRFVSSPSPPSQRQSPPPRMPLEVEDDFGDFASAPSLYSSPLVTNGGVSPSPFGVFQTATMSPSLQQSYQPSKPISQFHQPFVPSPLGPPLLAPAASSDTTSSFSKQSTPQDDFIYVHGLLRPLLTYLVPATPPHQLLTRLLPPVELPPQPLKHRSKPSLIPTSGTSAQKPWPSETYLQAILLHLLTLWLGASVKGVRKDKTIISDQILRGAVDRFEVAMLKEFEDADGRVDEWSMREAAWCAWEVWEWRDYVPKSGAGKALAGPRGNGLLTASGLMFGGGIGSTGEVTSAIWEVGKVWIERREVFYETGRWDPNLNFTAGQQLSFGSFVSFITHVLETLRTNGSVAIRVFPPLAQVLLLFSHRLVNEVLGEYVTGVLNRARDIDAEKLNQAREAASEGVYLQACAASFMMSWKIIGVLVEIGKGKNEPADPSTLKDAEEDALPSAGNNKGQVSRWDAEEIVFRMFEPHMDEYLDEEIEAVKRNFDSVCKSWEAQMKNHALPSVAIDGTRQTFDLQTRFVTSQNPAQIKRNVLKSFGNVLLLPVTIIPRAVGAVGTVAVTGVQAIGSGVVTGVQAVGSGVATVGSVAVGGAVNGISMLNPAKWGGASKIDDGYTREGDSGAVIWSEEMYDDDQEYEPAEDVEEFVGQSVVPIEDDPWAQPAPKPPLREKPKVHRRAKSSRVSPSSVTFSPVTAPSSTNGSVLTTLDSGATSTPNAPVSMDNLDLFLSIDTALALIHAARDPLKRLESFFPPPPAASAADGFLPSSMVARQAQATQSAATKPLDRRASLSVDDENGKYSRSICGFPGQTGVKLRETIQEVFVLLLIALRERHLEPGFNMAVEQMREWKPLQHQKVPGAVEPKKDEEAIVAPLLGFFELVHVGDTIGSMVQVYFDREMAHHLDKTDFLSPVNREKKRFENSLDESVAKGLNTATEVLMAQIEHLLYIHSGAREYYPIEGQEMELGPTNGCKEVIRCLEVHCRLVKGSAAREVLEVFYIEVGTRLHGLIQKHLKRQIISLQGGFQVIADLNAYHSFVLSLKIGGSQNGQQLAQDFAAFKMLGHVYIVEDAKDLAAIVRDTARYGGRFRPEDVYEFIQRRSDWKKIEKTVDKTMYNLSFKEDCVIC